MILYLLLLICLFIKSNQISIGYIYIDKTQSNNKITLAENHTLPSLSEYNITIRTTLTPQQTDIDFTWTIIPSNLNRFLTTDGFVTIKQFTNSTVIKIATRDTIKPNLDDVNFIFKLDKLTTNFVNLNEKFYFNSSSQSIAINLLPSNYPFGLFEFSKTISRYMTVSRYSYLSLADAIRIDRKFGSNYRVLIEFKQIETNNSINKTSINFIEFDALETFKIIKFSSVYKNDLTNNEYPRNFILTLSSAILLDGFLLDGVPENASDVFPKIGKFSEVYITVIDDKSIIEFVNTEFIIDSIYKNEITVNLTLTRSSLSNLNKTVLVNFLTVPLYFTNMSNIDYYPARAYLDYSPPNGQFIFQPESQFTNFTFKIYQNDDYYFNNLNRKYRVYLLSIENCDGCQLGFKTEANIVVNAIKQPFRNLIKLNDLTIVVNNTIFLNPSVQLNKICFESQVSQGIVLEYEIKSSNDNLLLETSFNSSNDKSILFNDLQPTECILIQPRSNINSNISIDKYCFSIDFLIEFNTSYVINYDLNLISEIVSFDTYKTTIFNTNCFLNIQLDPKYLIVSNNYIETNNTQVTVNLYEYNSFNFLIQIPFKVSINKFVPNLRQVDLEYQINADPGLDSYFNNSINQILVFRLNLTSTPNGLAPNYLNLYLKNLNDFPYYMMSVNLTLLTNRDLKLYKLLTPSSIKIDFIIKNILTSNMCGVISLDNFDSKFSISNDERELILSFRNDLTSSLQCVLNSLYIINYINKTTQSPINSIDKYISVEASNFFYQFTPIRFSEKQIYLKNNAYIDLESQFLVNLISLISAKDNTNAYIKSISDSYVYLTPSSRDSNGPAYIKAYLYYELNLTNPYDVSNYNLKININLNRQATYGSVKANLELLLIEPVNKSLDQLNAINKNIAQIELVLEDGQTSKSIEFSIQYLIEQFSPVYSDLILFGNMCFINHINDVTAYCSKLNAQIPVEPDGLFQFSGNNTKLVINQDINLIDSIIYYVERRLGSLNSINLFYSLTSSNTFADFFFASPLISFIQFKSGQINNSFRVKMNPVIVNTRKDFFIYLTNTQRNLFNTNKISKYNNYVQISILPNLDYIDTIVFTQSYLKIPVVNNAKEFNLTLQLSRIGLVVNNPIYCKINSAGQGETIPAYILAIKPKNSILAYSNYDYYPIDSIVKFDSEFNTTNITLLIKTNFNTDFDNDNKRLVYLYLNEPLNGARLIEPLSNTAYSPFIQLELNKINSIDSNNLTQKIQVGFINKTQTTELISNFTIKIQLNQNLTNVKYLNELFELKWTAELILSNETDVKIYNLIKCGIILNDTQCSNVINCNSTQSVCDLIIFFKTNIKIYRDYTIRIFLYRFKSYTYPTDFLITEVMQDANVTYLEVYANSQYEYSIGFDKYSRLNINNKVKLDTDLVVELEGTSKDTVTIQYKTIYMDNLWFYFNSIKMYTADPEYDFEPTSGYIKFLPGVKTQTIRINLRAALLLDSRETQTILYPRMFQVILFNCTPDCNIKYPISNVTILADNINLWRVYREVLNEDLNTNLNEIEQISLNNELDITSSQSDLIVETMRQIISQQKDLLNANNFNLAELRKNKILNILCNLLGSNRPSLDGMYNYINLLQDTLYSTIDLYNSSFSYTNSTNLNFDLTKFKCIFTYFNYYVNRFNSSNNLPNLTYSSDELKFDIPFLQSNNKNAKQIIHLDNNSSNPILTLTNPYTDLVVVELLNVNWIDSLDNLLNGRSVLFGIRQSISNNLIQVINSSYQSYPIKIRFYFSRAIQTTKKCSIFDSSLKEWKSKFCQTSKGYNYIDCECLYESVYGIVSQNDPFYYGFDHTWFYVSIGFYLFATFSAFFTYFFCLNLYSFSSFCLMQFFASSSFAHLTYLITVAISSQIIVDEPDANNTSCTILGIFFHYFVLTQFTWIFICSLTYYLIFVKDVKNSFYLKLGLILLGWLGPILIISIFYLITGLIYEYQLNYSAAFIYTDVLDNKEMCFIKNIWAYLGGLIFPSVLLLIVSSFFLVVLFKNLPKWKGFDDIYFGRFNQSEIKLNLLLWLIVFIVNIWAALQIRFGYLWLFIVFCIFDILASIFIFIAYTFQRHILRLEIFNQINTSDQILTSSNNNINLINNSNEDIDPKLSSSITTSTIQNNENTTSDLNRLINIFKTNSVHTINSNLSVLQNQDDEISKELNDLKLLLDASNLINQQQENNLITKINQINYNDEKFDQEKDELETEIKEEYFEKNYNISYNKNLNQSPLELVKSFTSSLSSSKLQDHHMEPDSYANIYEISITEV